MVFELFSKDVPKTAENFRALCTGEKGECKVKKGKKLHYKGSILHRVIPEFAIQGGDFTNADGTGGESIYGDKFQDENFKHNHNDVGVLSMANGGPNTNGSQFFITTAPCPKLDGQHVVFGKLIEGLEVLQAIEKLGSKMGKPKSTVRVVDCGEIPAE